LQLDHGRELAPCRVAKDHQDALDEDRGKDVEVLVFLASVLATYPARHSLDDAALAAVLGCSVGVLTSLRLCRRPGAAQPGPTAALDVAAMAARFGVDAAALRQVVEESDKRP